MSHRVKVILGGWQPVLAGGRRDLCSLAQWKQCLVVARYTHRVPCLQDASLEGPSLVTAMADAVGVFYNWSGTVPCFDWSAAVNNDTKEDSDFWCDILW